MNKLRDFLFSKEELIKISRIYKRIDVDRYAKYSPTLGERIRPIKYYISLFTVVESVSNRI